MSSETQIEFVKGTINNADLLVKWAFILNGASAAGLLTFLGNTIEKQDKFHNWELFGTSLILFGGGLCITLVCSFFKLMTLNFIPQILEFEKRKYAEGLKLYLKVGDRAVIWGVLTFVFFIIAMICFIIGIFFGKIAIFG